MKANRIINKIIMPFKEISISDKISWLDYLIKMETLCDSEIKSLNEKSVLLNMSKVRLKKLKEVHAFNKNFYAKIKDDLVDGISKNELLSVKRFPPKPGMTDPFSFAYFIRDWGQSKSGENLDDILNLLSKTLTDLEELPNGEALFIGCGSGRYVVDLSAGYDKIHACDISLPMIWSIYYLMEVKEWRILRSIVRNCRTVADSVFEETLCISKEQNEAILKKINFFVADVQNLKLKNSCVNHIYSIYFTDVLPLKTLFKQINRLLKYNGLFIHFGPLDYFFDDVNEMYSAEEVRAFFELKNYEVLESMFMSTNHLLFEKSMRNKVYDNWFFVARKSKNRKLQIDLDKAIILNENVELNFSSQIEHGANLVELFSISLNDISYDLPKIIYEVLKNTRLNFKLSKLLKELKIDISNKEELSEILNILQTLMDNSMIVISDK